MEKVLPGLEMGSSAFNGNALWLSWEKKNNPKPTTSVLRRGGHLSYLTHNSLGAQWNIRHGSALLFCGVLKLYIIQEKYKYTVKHSPC